MPTVWVVEGPKERTTASIKAVLRDLDRVELSLLLLKLDSVCQGHHEKVAGRLPLRAADPAAE